MIESFSLNAYATFFYIADAWKGCNLECSLLLTVQCGDIMMVCSVNCPVRRNRVGFVSVLLSPFCSLFPSRSQARPGVWYVEDKTQAHDSCAHPKGSWYPYPHIKVLSLDKWSQKYPNLLSTFPIFIINQPREPKSAALSCPESGLSVMNRSAGSKYHSATQGRKRPEYDIDSGRVAPRHIYVLPTNRPLSIQ